MKKVYQLPITLGSFPLLVNIVIEIGRLSLKNDEKCFLFHLKSSFRSQDI